jgi:flagellar hook-associated protein 2
MALQLSGLASGMDTKALIDQLMAIDQQASTKLTSRKAQIQSKSDAYRALNTKLQTLQGKAFTLTQLGTIIARSASTGDDKKVTGTATADTPTGAYNIEVVSLATATKVASGTGAGVGNNVGGMGKVLTAGDGAQTLASLNAANRFGAAITSGSFTVDGQTVTIDVNTDTLDSVFTKIAAATSGAVTGRVGDGGSDGAGFDNKVILSKNTAGALTIGSAGDSSNFLKALKLDNALASTDPATPGNSAIVSTAPVSMVQRTTPLNAANFSEPVGAGATFSINGVNVDYDITKDSLMDVINRINSSAAGVTASYDSAKDQVVLQSRTTGSGSITLDDKGGSLLKAMGLANGNTVTGTVTTGGNAVYKVNGTSFSATSNTVADAGGVQGLSLTLKDVTTSSVQVNVGVDTSKAQKAVQEFLDAYNAFADDVEKYTHSSDPKVKAVLQGDTAVLSARDRILNMLVSPTKLADGSNGILAELGISSGEPGSNPISPGSKGIRYQLDAVKLGQAIANNPNRVAEITGGLGTNGIFTKVNTYLRSASSVTGAFTVAQNSAKSQMKDIDDQLDRMDKRLESKRLRLEAQFRAMEKAMSAAQSQQNAISGMIAKLGQSD